MPGRAAGSPNKADAPTPPRLCFLSVLAPIRTCSGSTARRRGEDETIIRSRACAAAAVQAGRTEHEQRETRAAQPQSACVRAGCVVLCVPDGWCQKERRYMCDRQKALWRRGSWTPRTYRPRTYPEAKMLPFCSSKPVVWRAAVVVN